MTHHQNAPPRPVVTEIESGAQVSSVSGLRGQFNLAADFAQLRGDEASNLIEPRLFARLGLALDQLPNRFENRLPARGVMIEQSAIRNPQRFDMASESCTIPHHLTSSWL